MNKVKFFTLQRGFSLLEIMMVTSVSLFLLTLLMSIFLLIKRHYHLEQAEATMQANARIAAYLLQQDLRRAGYIGCAKLADVASLLEQSAIKSIPSPHSVGGSSGIGHAWQPSLTAKLQAKVKPNTDVITLWYRDELAYPVLPIADKLWQIDLKNNPLTEPAILLIVSCRQAELLDYKPAFTLSTRHFIDKEGAEIAKFHNYAYYISESESSNLNARPVYGLFRKSLLAPHSRAQELAVGIEAMRVAYGVQFRPGAALIFLRAHQISDWERVQIVRIQLLLSSLEKVLDKPQTYEFAGQQYQSQDGILRKEWLIYVYRRQV